MVYDRLRRGPALINGELLIGLSQEEAAEIKDQLEQYFSGGSTA